MLKALGRSFATTWECESDSLGIELSSRIGAHSWGRESANYIGNTLLLSKRKAVVYSANAS